jgi:hypothetical protein
MRSNQGNLVLHAVICILFFAMQTAEHVLAHISSMKNSKQILTRYFLRDSFTPYLVMI